MENSCEPYDTCTSNIVSLHLPTLYAGPGSYDSVPTNDGVLDKGIFLAEDGVGRGFFVCTPITTTAKICLRQMGPTVPTHKYLSIL